MKILRLSKLIALVVLFASLLLPVAVSAASETPAKPAAPVVPIVPGVSGGNTISFSARLSGEYSYMGPTATSVGGGTIMVTSDLYDDIQPTDLTTRAVSNVNGYLDQAGVANFVALGMYSDYTGITGYINTSLPAGGVVCSTYAVSAFGGRGCTMRVLNVSMSIASNRLVTYNVTYNGLNGTWYFYLRDQVSGVFWQIAQITNNIPYFTSPSLQTAINYQGAIYPGTVFNTIWIHPQGWSASAPIASDFASATAVVNITNLLDSAICSGGFAGTVVMIDPHDLIVGTLSGLDPWICNGVLWPRAAIARRTNAR